MQRNHQEFVRRVTDQGEFYFFDIIGLNWRRIASTFGKARIGRRIVAATPRTLAAVQKRPGSPLWQSGSFVETLDHVA